MNPTEEPDDRPDPPRIDDIPPERLVSVGGPVSSFSVSLRAFGPDLDPDNVTSLLGASPTQARRRGERLPGHYKRSARESSWVLCVDRSETIGSDISQIVEEVLARLTDDLKSWAAVRRQARMVDFFIGISLNELNQGFGIPPELSRKLADRGVEIGFDIYANPRGGDSES